MKKINIIIYSYRNRKLKDVVDNIYNTSSLKDFSITLLDQNNVRRHQIFEGYENLDYSFILWDSIVSPCERKSTLIHDAKAEFTMILSDDAWLSEGWDKRLLDFLHENDVVVSGNGVADLSYKDIYTIVNTPKASSDFAISQYIDRNLIIGRTATLDNVGYPGRLKYYGEEEMLSIRLLANGVDIYSAPSDLYKDLEQKTVERLYSVFSKYHNFNNVYRAIQSGRADSLLEYHKLDKDYYRPAPDLINDVEYRIDTENYFTDSARKFVEKVDGLNYGKGMVK